MLQAILHGKLSSSIENMEDVLTSCVFGSFEHLDCDDGLGSFIREARGSDPNCHPFENLKILKAEYEFWPYWSETGYENCEPDVVLRLQDADGQRLMILVEVKYLSGKSAYANYQTEAPTDQLAKEWDHLVRIADKEKYIPKLVYVTADVIFPKDDISEAAKEFETKRVEISKTHPFECWWISWRSLYRILERLDGVLPDQLRKLAIKLNFREFDGYSDLRGTLAIHWQYKTSYTWAIPEKFTIDWSYGQ